jgi:predicted alpha/beta-hydrolase family hydrolase
MPQRPLIVFAPGAGAPSSSPWMRAWARRLQTLGSVVPFDYPYMRQQRRAPDKLPVLVAAHREALDQARLQVGADAPVVLAGKSMGSRVGCHLAVELVAQGHPPAALICFGYPLRAAGTGAMRDEVLRQLTTPVLFLAGSRDPLCPLDNLEQVRPAMSAPTDLFVVDGGDHSLAIRRKQPAPDASGRRRASLAGAPSRGGRDPLRVPSTTDRTQAEWDDAILDAARSFLIARGLRPGPEAS